MVPSWTETLIEAGIDVVGRTRYCVHPQLKVVSIPVVGGTKDANFNLIQSLNADLVILDKEENPKLFSEKLNIPFWASQIEKIQDMPPALTELSSILKNKNLLAQAKRWQALKDFPSKNIEEIPGVLEWWTPPTNAKKFIYIIWKKPWMSINQKTFIGSMIRHLGLAHLLIDFNEKYPKFDLTEISKDTLLLFSSEPYHFAAEKEALMKLGFPCALVDGEKWSWFGIRSLRFLEQINR